MQRLDMQRKTALLAILAACSAVFLTALDQTVVVTALPKIIADLQIPTEQLYRAVEAQGLGRKGTHALMLALAQLSQVDWKPTAP